MSDLRKMLCGPPKLSEAKWLGQDLSCRPFYNPAVPNVIGTRDRFPASQFFHGWEQGVGENGSGGNASHGEPWGVADEASLTRRPFTSCCAARLLTGRGPVLDLSLGVGDPCYNPQQEPPWLSNRWLLLVLWIPVPGEVSWNKSTEHAEIQRERAAWREQCLPIQATINTLLGSQKRLLTHPCASMFPHSLFPHSSQGLALSSHHAQCRPFTMACEALPPTSPLFPHSFSPAWSG